MHPLADTGRVIAGRYRLQAPIGRGAMGVVWRARDQLLDRDVAVKEVQIAETLTDAERANAYQRTLREAKTAARLNHPAVVTVYDVCEDEGRPWIVMQLVSAQSLDQVLAASGPLSPRRAAGMARQLLSALSVAHAAGVMHRDVKPSNVLLGSDDRAVLTDFGIATFQGDPKLTQTGMVMGSPGFTAPERIRGEDASPASDLWSLGATLFAAVEGHGPFERRGGAITTMSAIINEDAPQAPTAGALGPVIAALLRREPADRPDASEAERMINDVLPLLADQPPGAPAGYEPTALSASSRPAPPQPDWAQPDWAQPGSGSPQPGSPQPGSVPPRLPQPDATSLDFASAEQTIAKEPPAAGTDPLAGGLASAAQTAPTTPQPVQGDPPRYPPPGSSWGQGAGTGYPPEASAGSAARPEGPPADFSSWYDPSPRSGAAPQPGSGSAWSESASASSAAPASQAGSGAAQAPQPGYGPSSWSGSASHQPPGPAPWSGTGYETPQRKRSGAGWKIAIAALAIIGAGAGAATVVLLHQNHSGSPQGSTSATGSASGSSTATLPSAKNAPQIVNAINVPATGPLPNGFTTISQPAAANEAAGFSLAAPTSWQESTSGYQTYLRDPAEPNTNILIDLTPHTYPNDMLREAQYIEERSISGFPGYHRLGLAAITIRNTPGAYWKFTWVKSGVEQQAIDLLFVLHTSAGPQSYALYMTAPANIFDQIRPIFDEEVETFATVPS
ncbi:MAG: protein kinase domain-containing protein [Streptosporangiaceae bacterium]